MKHDLRIYDSSRFIIGLFLAVSLQVTDFMKYSTE